MKIKDKLLIFSVMFVGSFFFFSKVDAATTPTLSLTNTAGDTVQISITGDANSAVKLSFWVPGSSTAVTTTFGATDSSGNFSTLISSGGYGIPSGSPAYVTVNGAQSAWVSWPSYTSSITLTKSSLQIAIGQSVSVGASSAIILAANSLTSIATVAVSGSQATITGLQNGSGSLTMCGSGVGCVSLPVVVGAEGQTEVSFNENNITIHCGESKNVTIFGSSKNGYRVNSNNNTASLYASISGTSNILSIFGENTPGAATVVVCSVEESNNCASLYITILASNASTEALAFSQNNINLIPGLRQTVTVSGGPNDSYYIASNSSSGVAVASVSGALVTVTGGTNTGSTNIRVCSTSANATCGTLYVNCNADTTTASETVISFSQNVVSMAEDTTSHVTVSGGTGTGYTISSNTHPEIVTATVASGSSILNLYGEAVGSSIITVCSATVGSTCASLYVNVTSALLQIYFTPASASLTPGSKAIISVLGETGAKNVAENSNPNVASAVIDNAGNILLLTGGNTAGATSIKVCSSANASNCATITATLAVNATTSQETSSDSGSTADNSSSDSDSQLRQIASDVSALIAATNSDSGIINSAAAFLAKIITAADNAGDTIKNYVSRFIVSGTSSTLKLGAGERAGVIGSFKTAFNRLPTTENDWSDIVKIANGRWPSATSESAIASAKTEFAKVYKRQANMSNANDNAAVSIIAYGLRPNARNTDSEKAAIKTFRSVYGHDPVSSLAWDIVRAIAYSGAKR